MMWNTLHDLVLCDRISSPNARASFLPAPRARLNIYGSSPPMASVLQARANCAFGAPSKPMIPPASRRLCSTAPIPRAGQRSMGALIIPSEPPFRLDGSEATMACAVWNYCCLQALALTRGSLTEPTKTRLASKPAMESHA
jgi:hypothetical protein